MRFPEFTEEWKKSTIGSLSTKVGSGVTPRGGETVYKSEGHSFVRSQNVGWGHLQLDDIAFIDKETHLRQKNTELQLDDVLLNITGASIGRSALVNKQIVGGNVNQHVCIIRTKDNLVPSFLCNFLLSNHGQKQIDSFQAGGNRQGLNFEQIKSIKITIPSTKEQAKIATLLHLIDERIATQNKIIDRLQSLIKGLTNQLLIPNSNWQPTTIGQVLTINSGKDYKHLKEGNIPVYGTGGYMLSVNDYLYDGESVCIGRKGTINKPIFLTGKFWTVDTLFYTSNFNSLLPRFGYYLFKTIDWLKYNEASGVPSLSKVSIEKIHISLPSLAIQNSICRLLDSIYNKLALEESVLNNHQTQKAFILQQMFI